VLDVLLPPGAWRQHGSVRAAAFAPCDYRRSAIDLLDAHNDHDVHAMDAVVAVRKRFIHGRSPDDHRLSRANVEAL
jgi:hypothetical protein